MQSQEIIALEKQYVLHTYNRPEFVVERGEGCWLYDQEGRRYLDVSSGIAVSALGHAHPAVVETIRQAADGLLHISNLYHNTPMSVLARDLVESCFADRVFFCNSGSEANEGALKFARKYARVALEREDKTEIVAFENSFHGRSMGALSTTATEKYRTPFEPLVPGVRFAPFNDVAAAQAAITEQTCAVIVEPVQGEGGVTPATTEFLQALRQRCDETGALLIFDEVQCGVGRTGHIWAHQGYGVEPDIMSAAKPLAGGLPMGAILLTDKVAQAIQPGDHGSTFAGGPFVSAVAGTVFNTVNTPDFLGEVQEKGDKLHAGLQKLAENSSLITEVRGKGLMWGLVTTVPAGPIMQKGYEHGLFILVAGPNVVRLLPPLTISSEEIDFLLEEMGKIFTESEAEQ